MMHIMYDLSRKGGILLRILVIAPEQLPVPPIKGGSVESCIYNIFRRMAQTDKVVLISRSHSRLSHVSKHGENMQIIRIPSGRQSDYIRAALRRVKGQRFDVIQIENRPTFVPIVRRTFPRTPVVLSLHSLTFMSYLPRNRAQQILRQVNGVTSVVSFVTQTMKNRYPKYADKFRTAILGCDTNKFRPRSLKFKQKLRKKWGVSGSFNTLFVGRIVYKKGLHTLVRTVGQLRKHHPRMRIVAVGASWPGVSRQTPYMRQVRQMSKRLGVPIRFTGYIPPARVHDMYHLGDVFVNPTQYREGFATVNSEAMASGIPVIASNRGGIREVVKHGQSGLLVDAYGSPTAFANAIARVKASPALARRLAQEGRKRIVSQFSWFSTVRRLKAHYRSIQPK